MRSVQKRKKQQQLKTILLCILFILIGCLITVLIIQAQKDNKDNKPGQERQVAEADEVQENSSENEDDNPLPQKSPEVTQEPRQVAPPAVPIPDTGEEKVYTKEYIDAKVEEIRAYYYATQDRLSSLAVQDTGRYKYYLNSNGKVEKVDFIMSGIGYYASYYYHNDELYFAFIWMGSRENRFYIEDGKILRWIDTEKNVVDITAPDERYYWWEDLIFGKNNISLPY